VGWPFFQVLEIERCLRFKPGPVADTISPFSYLLLDRGRVLFNEEEHSLEYKVMPSFSYPLFLVLTLKSLRFEPMCGGKSCIY
jgi:hypothetical protein